jgi:hypothetical protein
MPVVHQGHVEARIADPVSPNFYSLSRLRLKGLFINVFMSFFSFRKEGEESLSFLVVLPSGRTTRNDITKQPRLNSVQVWLEGSLRGKDAGRSG